MARVDKERDERHQETITLSHLVQCEECATEFEAFFDTGEYDIEMVDDDELTTTVVCPSCMCEWEQEYEGWSHRTDAG